MQVNRKTVNYYLNASKQKKRVKKFHRTFKFHRTKYMALKLVEVHEKIMIDTFLMKITQFEKKTGSISKC